MAEDSPYLSRDIHPLIRKGCCYCSVAESCLTFCHPMDWFPPGSSVLGVYRQEYWSGLPFPFLGNLPNAGNKSGSPALQAEFLMSEPPRKPSKFGKEYVKAVYLTYMQSTSREMSGWMKHTLESRLPGEISITSDTQMTPPLRQKVKMN